MSEKISKLPTKPHALYVLFARDGTVKHITDNPMIRKSTQYVRGDIYESMLDEFNHAKKYIEAVKPIIDDMQKTLKESMPKSKGE